MRTGCSSNKLVKNCLVLFRFIFRAKMASEVMVGISDFRASVPIFASLKFVLDKLKSHLGMGALLLRWKGKERGRERKWIVKAGAEVTPRSTFTLLWVSLCSGYPSQGVIDICSLFLPPSHHLNEVTGRWKHSPIQPDIQHVLHGESAGCSITCCAHARNNVSWLKLFLPTLLPSGNSSPSSCFIIKLFRFFLLLMQVPLVSRQNKTLFGTTDSIPMNQQWKK